MLMKKVILTIMVAALAGFAGAQEKVTVGNKFFVTGISALTVHMNIS